MVAVFAVPGKPIIPLANLEQVANHPLVDTVFFICFRQTLETGIIVSVLLAFLKQTLGHDQDLPTYKKLKRQVSRLQKRFTSQVKSLI